MHYSLAACQAFRMRMRSAYVMCMPWGVLLPHILEAELMLQLQSLL